MSVNSQENVVKDSCASLNTSAPVIFVQSLQHQVNEHDIHAIIQSQKHMLARFEKTNEMLVNCNALLASRHVGASKELKKHIAFLIELKKDLETIFRRIRFLKMKLSQQYGEAFHVAANSVLDEEEEQEEKPTKPLNDSNIASAANVSSSGSRESSPCSFTSPSTSDTG
ncbi:kxDL motif-containing protein CG10681 [Trichonephila inaurata madagascariensis]|uniref:KxDL motif-containing protein CG10681 n=1 Tax=Trichonephila inaurata madagascariensis TaxID=2747483 RepID=A0A8X6WS07_9ARAC|nr:kxDL motif-containing protein CG10681 [Trichonephila inaurata madagascariensis]